MRSGSLVRSGTIVEGGGSQLDVSGAGLPRSSLLALSSIRRRAAGAGSSTAIRSGHTRESSTQGHDAPLTSMTDMHDGGISNPDGLVNT